MICLYFAILETCSPQSRDRAVLCPYLKLGSHHKYQRFGFKPQYLRNDRPHSLAGNHSLTGPYEGWNQNGSNNADNRHRHQHKCEDTEDLKVLPEFAQ